MNSIATQGNGRPSPEDEGALPVLFSHSKDVYEAMLRTSSKQGYKEGGEDKEAVVYEGFLTKLVTEELRLAVPYYTTIMTALKKMGCARQLRRGGSTSPSQWVLYHEPTEELYRDKVQRWRKPIGQNATRLDALEANLLQVGRRVSDLEAILHRELSEQEESEDTDVLS